MHLDLRRQIRFLLLTCLLLVPQLAVARDGYRFATFSTELIDLRGADVSVPNDFAFPLALGELRTQLATTQNPQRRVAVRINPGQFVTTQQGKGRSEAYYLKIHSGGVDIAGSDAPGVLYGILTLSKLLREGQGRVRSGEIYDWPTHPVRALHLVLRKTRPDDLRRLIRAAADARLNTLILALSDGVKLERFPGKIPPTAIDKDEFLDLCAYARSWGLAIVPEIKLLSHQGHFFGTSRPELMYNQATYDPRQAEVYRHVFAALDEIIALIHPKAIHIGHDEIAGLIKRTADKWLKAGEAPLPPNLFLADVQKIHGYLHSKGIETWMWGDMLLNPLEFPQMRFWHLHGNRDYAALRTQLPKDIVICDWHYFDQQVDFPSAKAFADLGHPVLGATWKTSAAIENFSNYIARLPQNGRGMIATTWFHVQKGEWRVVDDIIKTSGDAYWHAN